MSKFSFTSADGQTFDLLGPPGATVEQARAIFDQQTRSGGLVGLRAGDVVSANTQAAAGLRSALSQVGIQLPSSVEQAFASLKNVPVTNPLSASDFIKQATPNFSLGPLNSTNVQALMAQTSAQVGQRLNEVSSSTGIGKFGLDISKLENAGYIKPGTARSYALSTVPISNQKLESFLSPAVFTGKDGISNIQGILANETIQNKIQQTTLQQSFNSLVNRGITQGLSTTQLGSVLQTAAKFDVKTAVDFVKGQDVKNISEVLSVAKAGEYATALVDKIGINVQQRTLGDLGNLTTQLGNIKSIGDLGNLSKALGGDLNGLAKQIGQLGNLGGIAGGISGFAGAAGAVVGLVSGLFGGRGGSIYTGVRRPQGSINTVNRNTVDSSIQAILGNAKITTPSFNPQSSQILGGLTALKALSGIANMAIKLSA